MSFNLMELLKSSGTQNKWEDVIISLRNGIKDNKMNEISKGLMLINNYLNKNGRQLNSSREKPIEYIKMICKQKKLTYSETPRNGLTCLELSGDCFRIVIVTHDIRMLQVSSTSDLIKQVLIEYNKEKPTSCPELQKSLSDGDYSLLLVHIEELLQLYSVGNDRTQQLKAFLCLQSLEEDINKLSQCQIVSRSSTDSAILLPQPTNIIGIIKPRSGGIPSQFVFYCPPSVTNIAGSGSSNTNTTDSDRFNIMVQLMPHSDNNLLPFIPLVNLQKDAKGNCTPSYVTADSLKCVLLAAKFVFKLSRPLVISETNISAITSITGLNLITVGESDNYIDILLEEAGSSLTYEDRFYSMFPNDTQVVFQILNETTPFKAKVVTSIPFLLPSQLPKIIAILKKQSIINMMMESFLLLNTKEEFDKDCFGALPINVTIVSHEEITCSFTQTIPSELRIKFSVSYNDYGQSIVKLICPTKSNFQVIDSPQKVMQKYNNLPMTIFWLLYKYGGLTMRESASFTPDSKDNGDISKSDLIQKENDCKFLKQCRDNAKTNVNIRSEDDKEIFPKIKIEPKLELLTTTFQQLMVNSPSLISHYEVPNPVSNKGPVPLPNPVHEQSFIPSQEYSGSFQNQYLQHQNNCHMPGQNNNLNTINNPISINTMNCAQSTSQSNQNIKSDQYQSYPGNSNKHMSLDQMLSSDFAMPFASDGMGAFNSMPHPMHYSEHSNIPPNVNSIYGNHMGNFKESPNSKNARQLESQSSVLVNLLNCNENSTSTNSNLLSRQISNTLIPQCFPPNNYLNDPIETSKNMQSQMLRGSQPPRTRMPHPNQPQKPNLGPNYNTNPSPGPPMSINRSPSNCKSDIMMMPYPQDTGNIRGVSIRKPRKRRAPNLELNQRLPKLQTSQFPLIQQPTPPEAMHLQNMNQLNLMQQTSVSIINPIQSSSSNASFSSPTTMDQSVYDFDDSIEISRIRTASTNSSISPHSMANANNVNRRVSSSGTKKPLKVKISRKSISQNPSLDSGSLDSQMSNNYETDMKMKEKSSMCRSNTMPNISNIILSAPSSTSSINTVIGLTTTASGINHSRPTAIMSAIDSPLTCSSMSSLQASPYGSMNIGSSQHSMPGVMDSCDGTEIKKRRKRKIKPDQGDDIDAIAKREKMEARKQNKKKKELGSVSGGMSSHGSMENLSGLIADSNLKPPLPIKLSLNAKTGSVSSNTVRNPKTTLPGSSAAGNQATGAWNPQTGSIVKQSSKESKTGIGSAGEPILRNYKIPKKKSSENHSGQESQHSHSKPVKDNIPDLMKSDNSTSSMFNDRSKSPDTLTNMNSFTQSSTMMIGDQDCKSVNDNQSSSATPKVKNLHDIVDRLLAKTSGINMSNAESIINSNSTPSVDMSQMKLPDYIQNSQENIFEKFSSSKSKSDHRQIPANRFPDPSMNVARYPFPRPLNSAYQLRAPVTPSTFNYGVRQPYGSTSAPVPPSAAASARTFPPSNLINPTTNNPQYHKKSSNNTAFPANRKKQ